LPFSFYAFLFDALSLTTHTHNSVTEWEVKSAVERELKERGDLSRLFWLHRVFRGGVPKTADNSNKCWDFHDVYGNDEKKANFDKLINWMAGLKLDRIEYDISFSSYQDQSESNGEWQQYKTKFAEDALALFKGSLDKMIDTSKRWNEDGCGAGVPGVELAEFLHHRDWATEKVREFYGREELVQEVLRHVNAASQVYL